MHLMENFMPIDSTGTPFVFAAWVTGMRDGMPLARIIDYLSPPTCGDDDGHDAGDACYGMEQGVVLLSGTDIHANPGTVILADRACVCSIDGHEAFNLDGSQWHIGVSPDEGGALAIMSNAIPPGSHTWPDVRWQEPQEVDDLAHDDMMPSVRVAHATNEDAFLY